MNRETQRFGLRIILITMIIFQSVSINVIGSESDDIHVIIDETSITDDRCDVGSTQTVGFHAKWSHNDSNVRNGNLFIEGVNPPLSLLSSGRELYDDFESTHINHSKWNVYGSVQISNGVLKIGPASKIRSTLSLSETSSVEFRMKAPLGKDSNNRLAVAGLRDSVDLDNAIFYDIKYEENIISIGTKLQGWWSPQNTIPCNDRTEWQIYRIERHTGFIKFYQNNVLLYEKTSHIPSVNLEIEFGSIGDYTFYIDDVVMMNSFIEVSGFQLGQVVNLYDDSDNLLSTGLSTGGSIALDVSSHSTPITGYFVISPYAGQQNVQQTPVIGEIWWGDHYLIGENWTITTNNDGWGYFDTTSISVSKKSWNVVGVNCNGVSTYNQSVSPSSIIWDKVSIQLSSPRERTNIGTSADIDYTGRYEYDNTYYQGSVTLNNSIIQDEIGAYFFSVERISDPKYGLTEFTSNSVNVIFDEIIIELSIVDDWINVGQPLDVGWSGFYASDQTPFNGQIVADDTSTIDLIGKHDISVLSVLDLEYGLTSFQTNDLSCVRDQIRIRDGGVSNNDSTIGNTESVWFKAVYQYTNDEFTNQDGTLFVNDFPLTWSSHEKRWIYRITKGDPGSIVFEITSVIDDNYGLTAINDEVGPLTISWNKPFWESNIGIALLGGALITLLGVIMTRQRRRV